MQRHRFTEPLASGTRHWNQEGWGDQVVPFDLEAALVMFLSNLLR